MTKEQVAAVGALVLVASAAGFVVAQLTADGRATCPGKLGAAPAEVLDEAKYSWDQLVKDADASGYDTRGESDHELVDGQGNPSGHKASIHRVHRSTSRKKTCFRSQPIAVAKIQSSGDFAPLSLAAGENYFVVWYEISGGTETWHGAVLNPRGRNEIPFTFEEHWQGNAPGNPDDALDPPDEMSGAVTECWKDGNPTRRACFVDSRTEWKKAGAPPPGQGGAGPLGVGAGLPGLQLFGGSQPWVSCAQYGCCCGGTNCHS